MSCRVTVCDVATQILDVLLQFFFAEYVKPNPEVKDKLYAPMTVLPKSRHQEVTRPSQRGGGSNDEDTTTEESIYAEIEDGCGGSTAVFGQDRPLPNPPCVQQLSEDSSESSRNLDSIPESLYIHFNRGRQTSTGMESNGRSSSEHDSIECLYDLTRNSTPVTVVQAPSPSFSSDKRNSSSVTVNSLSQANAAVVIHEEYCKELSSAPKAHQQSEAFEE